MTTVQGNSTEAGVETSTNGTTTGEPDTEEIFEIIAEASDEEVEMKGKVYFTEILCFD